MMRIKVCFLPSETESKCRYIMSSNKGKADHQVTAATHNHECIYVFKCKGIYVCGQQKARKQIAG